jgi:hypothetical protein
VMIHPAWFFFQELNQSYTYPGTWRDFNGQTDLLETWDNVGQWDKKEIILALRLLFQGTLK